MTKLQESLLCNSRLEATTEHVISTEIVVTLQKEAVDIWVQYYNRIGMLKVKIKVFFFTNFLLFY